jgi:hypothetical protein
LVFFSFQNETNESVRAKTPTDIMIEESIARFQAKKKGDSMPQVTSGSVSYSRTVQVNQFEPCKSDISLSFQVLEGEEIEDVIDEVLAIAKAKVLQSLGLKK